MNKYINQVIINGVAYSHIIEASSYKEALEINKQRKEDAKRRGRKIVGRLVKN